MVRGRLDVGAAAGQRDEADAIARREVVDQALQAIERGPAVAETEVAAIDDEEDDPGRLGDVVAADIGQPPIRRPFGGAHRDQLEGVDLARLAVDGEDEVVGGEASDGPAVLVHDDRVDRDEVDAGAEHGLLRASDQGHDDEGDGEGGQPHGDQRATLPPRRRPLAGIPARLAPNDSIIWIAAHSRNWIFGLPNGRQLP